MMFARHGKRVAFKRLATYKLESRSLRLQQIMESSVNLKHLILITTLILATASPSLAQMTAQNCADIESIARDVMTARQNDLPISKVMSLVKDSLASSPVLSMVGQQITIDAYNEPGYLGAEMQQKAIADFANDKAVVCYGLVGN